jgi:hypothetical protein
LIPPASISAAVSGERASAQPRPRCAQLDDSDGGQLPHFGEPNVVARGVAERRVDPVRPLLGLLDELEAAALQLLVRRMDVVGREETVPAKPFAIRARTPGGRRPGERTLG